MGKSLRYRGVYRISSFASRMYWHRYVKQFLFVVCILQQILAAGLLSHAKAQASRYF